mmetsp:Transcript_9358/g.16576  ORF Transcript_9358/g.16576 Transcript_9358/m.16576 type:complete len:182 (+) Transcript_9358:37-582(+)|eukprot:CAMPEP_0197630364 /NCGR_PEP_ID=MMETSP1338-20131121/7878_1 /TAXON_ID=43686 ORGANISM="Pelagodinium beii, Strain RCC1491" /NCGR_SAMPLE_ID=MMETSP1338 /ASSEMBLY_ACC=CAM_ASM_000754 /LENGTH=181 /DNA_ID=CAMNT_0043201569 /DNA_START=23 /DNA_END=568 /DNA_ORIENTATION=-
MASLLLSAGFLLALFLLPCAVGEDVALRLALARNDECFAEGCSFNALQRAVQHALVDVEEERTACRARRAPVAGSCYHGNALSTHLMLKIERFRAGRGKVSLWAKSPGSRRTCLNNNFRKKGKWLTVAKLGQCGLPRDVEYHVEYCSQPGEIVIKIVRPLVFNIPLRKGKCPAHKSVVVKT